MTSLLLCRASGSPHPPRHPLVQWFSTCGSDLGTHQIILEGPQRISLMCNIVFSLNSKQTNIQFKCIEGICTFLKWLFKDFLILLKWQIKHWPKCQILESEIVKIADLHALWGCRSAIFTIEPCYTKCNVSTLSASRVGGVPALKVWEPLC